MATAHLCDGCGELASEPLYQVGFIRPELEYCAECKVIAREYIEAVDKAQEAAAKLFLEMKAEIEARVNLGEFPY